MIEEGKFLNSSSNLLFRKVVKKHYSNNIPSFIIENEEQFLNFGILDDPITKGFYSIKCCLKNDTKDNYFRVGFVNKYFITDFKLLPMTNTLGYIIFISKTLKIFVDGIEYNIKNKERFENINNLYLTITLSIKNEAYPSLILEKLEKNVLYNREDKIKLCENNYNEINFYINNELLEFEEGKISLLDGIYYPLISIFGMNQLEVYKSHIKNLRLLNK